jgi:hypothetical protein
MNKAMGAVIVCSLFALPASADTISGGKITSVNTVGTSFNYARNKKHWRFKITDAPLMRVGNKAGRLSDIKIRQPAKMEFQHQGDSLAATIVGIAF